MDAIGTQIRIEMARQCLSIAAVSRLTGLSKPTVKRALQVGVDESLEDAKTSLSNLALIASVLNKRIRLNLADK